MIEILHQLEQIDTELLLSVNGLHCELLDYFMTMVSNRFTWIPFYAALLFVLAKNFDWKTSLTTLLAVALVVLLCDQTSSGLLKPMVGRLRPSNLDNPISPMVHVVNDYRGGRYGFPSSHSANSWGLAFFAMYLVRNKKLSLFLAVWAAMQCYSRMYLGVHYPGDILVGLIIGALMASLAYWGLKHFPKDYIQAWREHSGGWKYGFLPITIGTASFVVMLAISGIISML